MIIIPRGQGKKQRKATNNVHRHELFIYLWKDYKNSNGIFESPLLEPLQDTGFEDAQDADFTWDIKVAPKTLFEYITQVRLWCQF